MSTLSLAELRAQVETGLGDTPLQLIIDSVESEIDEFLGPEASNVTEYDTVPGEVVLKLPVEASAIVSISEWTDAHYDPTKTTLSSDDYELSSDGWWIRRLSDGTNARDSWGWHLVVTVTPTSITERRKQAAVRLARLEITDTGFSEETIGDWRSKSKDYGRARAQILSSLDPDLF